ncbi:GNAT family N-acyltransferase, partial [Pseudotabrizicola sp.]
STLGQSYAAQFYDLSRLTRFPGAMLELGRFCLAPDQHDPDILRLAWAAMTRMVDAAGVGLLFGCSSFAGVDPAPHAGALAGLSARVAPESWRPGPRAPERIALCDLGPAQPTPLPALLRTYLSMGGWVSDHAVIDRQLDTLHVLTGVEIAAIPAARARALRLIAAESVG